MTWHGKEKRWEAAEGTESGTHKIRKLSSSSTFLRSLQQLSKIRMLHSQSVCVCLCLRLDWTGHSPVRRCVSAGDIRCPGDKTSGWALNKKRIGMGIKTDRQKFKYQNLIHVRPGSSQSSSSSSSLILLCCWLCVTTGRRWCAWTVASLHWTAVPSLVRTE